MIVRSAADTAREKANISIPQNSYQVNLARMITEGLLAIAESLNGIKTEMANRNRREANESRE